MGCAASRCSQNPGIFARSLEPDACAPERQYTATDFLLGHWVGAIVQHTTLPAVVRAEGLAATLYSSRTLHPADISRPHAVPNFSPWAEIHPEVVWVTDPSVLQGRDCNDEDWRIRRQAHRQDKPLTPETAAAAGRGAGGP